MRRARNLELLLNPVVVPESYQQIDLYLRCAEGGLGEEPHRFGVGR
jgi:hypothetical protein